MRFGLCCLFVEEKIGFRTTTAKVLATMARGRQLEKISDLCLHNVRSLLEAVQKVQQLGIGAFRITSPLFPRMTHPEVGYELDDLSGGPDIRNGLAMVRQFCAQHDIRLSFHPDQFVVLASPSRDVVENSVRELLYHDNLADAVGADVINIHVGGVYGDKGQALDRFAKVFKTLPARLARRLSVENDDISYTVQDLLPLCQQMGLPLVYDVHHHRCNPDGLSVEEATRAASTTWGNREPYCHISSPRNGWDGKPRPHADYIDIRDFPSCWRGRVMTVDVEAKAKELAVVKLMEDLEKN